MTRFNFRTLAHAAHFMLRYKHKIKHMTCKAYPVGSPWLCYVEYPNE